ncbi:hemolysin family protein [Sphingomicrobium lutaoense]|uniref:CBS domain containing-hemolysin-like protein n=1 Tax=Sphingomicrobium lutaoense TaxID=515949 RepID=A0A839Z0P6_9SPHN|nr:hemolysin family protein [Sphingomicrobium lutaoense]MBB3763233.1 CBS domain containing-hemolysin-like protein [Sphingomicrobium lutaoense]
MASRPEEGSRLWRGMRALFFGDDAEPSLRDQIEEAIDEADAEPARVGDLSPHERQMLRNLLHFGDRTAGDICVPRGEIIAVSRDMDFDALVEAFAEAEHSRLPVTGEGLDDIVGMIHIKDLFHAKVNDLPHDIGALMRSPLFIPESMGVIDILGRMRSERVHLAIVVDEFGGTEGVVTIEDVVEEIVGEIEDEHDESDEPQLIMLTDGMWDADARIEMDEIIAKVSPELAWEEDDVDTIGGLAFLLAERILAPGESVCHPSGWTLECLEAEPKRMTRLRLHAPEVVMESDAD